MPWNCLCSSEKEKHKLQISAPILNRDDKRNAKIIQTSAKDGTQKIINPPFQRNVSQAEIAAASNNNYPDDSKLRIKRSKKTAKNAKDLHAQFPQSGEQQSSPKSTANVKFSADTIDLNANASSPVQTEEEDTTYSQLIFERKVNKPNEPSSANSVSTSTSHPNTGHYDRLPFDKVSKQSVSKQSVPGANHESIYTDHKRRLNRTSTGGGISSGDSIPFIDEEDAISIVEKHGTHLRINEGNDNNNDYATATTTRIITLHPKNIGSSQTIQRGNTSQRTHLSNTISNKSVSDAPLRQPRADAGDIVVIDSNENVVVQRSTSSTTPNQLGGVHEFFSWNPAKGKLCQICHASALNGSNTVVKCRSCDLVCHLWCVPKMTVSGLCMNFI